MGADFTTCAGLCLASTLSGGSQVWVMPCIAAAARWHNQTGQSLGG
jgi:hypothetical protein